MSNFTRGGQLSIHNVRMSLQVAKIMFRIILAIMVCAIGYTYYKDMRPNDWSNITTLIARDLYGDDSYISIVRGEYLRRTDKITVRAAKRDLGLNQLDKKLKTTLYKGLSNGAIISGALVALLILYFYRKGRKFKIPKQLRGVFLIPSSTLKRQINKHNKRFSYKPKKIVGMPYPITGSPESFTSGEQSHTLLVGSNGSAKSSSIFTLTESIWAQGDKIIFVDIKGYYLKKYYWKSNDTILNPLDERGSNWSIFNETNDLKGFKTIAKAIVPVDSKDPTWTEAARLVFAEMASLYSRENISMSEFVDKILKADLSQLASILKRSSAAKVINEDINKTALSVLMVLSSYLSPFRLYKSSKDVFSITEWVKNDKIKEGKTRHPFLFITSRADCKRDLNPLVTAQVDIAINALKSLDAEVNKPKVWFILDELSYFDNSIPSLIDGLATTRSYGGCFVIGAQDMSSLAKIYSRESAESIANNCKTKLFMNVEGAETARWCSDNIGTGEVEEWSESMSYGANDLRDGTNMQKNTRIRQAVIPSEFSQLRPGSGYIKFPGFQPAKFKTPFRSHRVVAPEYIENTELYVAFRKEIEESIKYRKTIERRIHDKSKKSTNKKEQNENRQLDNTDAQSIDTKEEKTIGSYNEMME